MTRGSVKEYLKAVELRYRKAHRKEKSRLLDEFVQVTGFHRRRPSGYGHGATKRITQTARAGPRSMARQW